MKKIFLTLTALSMLALQTPIWANDHKTTEKEEVDAAFSSWRKALYPAAKLKMS